ncbi:MAG: hypothetical protein ACXVP7_13900 [Actinomycetota bacterium]
MRRLLRFLYAIAVAVVGFACLAFGVGLMFGDNHAPVVRALGVVVFAGSWVVYRFAYPLSVRLFGPPSRSGAA